MQTLNFPVKSYENYPQEVLDGYTHYKSSKSWVATVVVKTKFATKVKLYHWKYFVKKGWKVAHANFDLDFIDLSAVLDVSDQFKRKYADEMR